MSDKDKDKGKSVEMNEMFEYPILADQTQSPIVKVMRKIAAVVDGPVEWFRANIVERYRGPKYYYYHQKFRRVPTIDQCYTDDQGCIYEANEQYKRDKKVDENILNILNRRYFSCLYYERNVNDYSNAGQLCLKELGDYKQSKLNFFIKYGDIGPYTTVIDAFWKQKHRLIWERRQAMKAENSS